MVTAVEVADDTTATPDQEPEEPTEDSAPTTTTTESPAEVSTLSTSERGGHRKVAEYFTLALYSIHVGVVPCLQYYHQFLQHLSREMQRAKKMTALAQSVRVLLSVVSYQQRPDLQSQAIMFKKKIELMIKEKLTMEAILFDHNFITLLLDVRKPPFRKFIF